MRNGPHVEGLFSPFSHFSWRVWERRRGEQKRCTDPMTHRVATQTQNGPPISTDIDSTHFGCTGVTHLRNCGRDSSHSVLWMHETFKLRYGRHVADLFLRLASYVPSQIMDRLGNNTRYTMQTLESGFVYEASMIVQGCMIVPDQDDATFDGVTPSPSPDHPECSFRRNRDTYNRGKSCWFRYDREAQLSRSKSWLSCAHLQR